MVTPMNGRPGGACHDLVVKVAGYNAFYTKLTRPLQDSIIARSEHRL
jgi:pyruvate-formate lyase